MVELRHRSPADRPQDGEAWISHVFMAEKHGEFKLNGEKTWSASDDGGDGVPDAVDSAMFALAWVFRWIWESRRKDSVGFHAAVSRFCAFSLSVYPELVGCNMVVMADRLGVKKQALDKLIRDLSKASGTPLGRRRMKRRKL